MVVNVSYYYYYYIYRGDEDEDEDEDGGGIIILYGRFCTDESSVFEGPTCNAS